MHPPGIERRVTGILILKDEVWFSTYGQGILRYKSGSWTSYSDTDGLPDGRVNGIATDGTYLYVATEGGASRFVLAAGTPSFENYRRDDGLPEATLSAVACVGKETWFGTKAHGLVAFGREVFEVTKQIGMAEGLPDNRILSLATDGKVLWVGTGSAGACRYNVRDGIMTIYNKTVGMVDNLVGSLAVGTRAWCGSWGPGVTVIDPEGRIVIYRVADGLPSGDIRSIAVDGDFVWFATANGVSRFKGEAGKAKGGIPLTYVVLGAVVVAALAIPVIMRIRTGKAPAVVEEKKRPYELCGGKPAGDLCPFCKYNVISGGKHRCSKYRIPIPFEG